MAKELIPYVTGKTLSDIATGWSNLAGQSLVVSTGHYENYNDANLANYEVAASAEQGTTGVYEVPVPQPAVRPVTLTYRTRDKGTGQIVATGVTRLDANGNAVDIEASSGDISLSVLPVVSTVQAGEVSARKIYAYQYAAFGPFTFAICDQYGASVNLSGRSIVFVAQTSAGKRLWQIDGCPVSGDDHNLVTVQADDENTNTAGELRYVLRNMTDDRVLARGELVIVADADAE